MHQRSPETRRTSAAVYRSCSASLRADATAEWNGDGPRQSRPARERRPNAGHRRQAPVGAAPLRAGYRLRHVHRPLGERRARRTARAVERRVRAAPEGRDRGTPQGRFAPHRHGHAHTVQLAQPSTVRPVSVLGIDLAARATKTHACVLEAVGGDLRGALHSRCDDDRLTELAAGRDKVAIDAPFGWPNHFIDALNAHRAREGWPAPDDAAAPPARTRPEG